MKRLAGALIISLAVIVLGLAGCPPAGPETGLVQGGVSYYVYTPLPEGPAGTRQEDQMGQLTLTDPGRPSDTARFMPRARLKVLSRLTGQQVALVEADNNGQFILPPLPGGQQYDIQALPPVGREHEFAPSEPMALRPVNGQIVSVSGSPIGAFVPQPQDFAGFFPVSVGDRRVYQILQGESQRPIGEMGEYVSALDTINDLPVARFVTYDPADPSVPIYTHFWSATSAGLAYHGGETPPYDGQVARTTLDPPLTIPNGLVLGEAGTSTSVISASFVSTSQAETRAISALQALASRGLVGTRQEEALTITIGYQLFGVGDTVQVPAGTFSDTLRVRYYYDMETAAGDLIGRAVLDYVLARGVGVIRSEDFQIILQDGQQIAVSGTVWELIYAEVKFGLVDISARPVVEIYSHYDGEEVFSPRQVLYGAAYSPQGVDDPTEAAIYVNEDLAATVPVVGGSFEASVDLRPGENEIEVRAENVNGLTSKTIRLVLVSERVPDVEVYLYWDADWTDCDLYMAEPLPNGELVGYFNTYGYVATLLRDNRRGFGPEIIEIPNDYLRMLPGTYAIGCNLYLGGPTTVRILVFVRGQSVFDDTRLLTESIPTDVWAPGNPEESYWSALTLDVDAQGNVTVGPAADPSAFWPRASASARSSGIKTKEGVAASIRERYGVRSIRPPTGLPGLRLAVP